MKHLFFIVLITLPFLGFSQWTQQGSDIDGDYAGDLSGYSVSLNSDGSIVAIGSLRKNGDASGHVSVYKNNSGTWSQMGLDIDGEDTADQFGYSTKISADGNTIAAGSRTNNGVNGASSGHVRVFTYSSGTNSWTQLGGDIDGKVADERFGAAVDLSSDGRTFVAGARLNSNSATWTGHAYVYTYNSGTNSWDQVGNDIVGEAERDQFGYSVAISNNGSIVAVGATRNDAGGLTDAGHVRVFSYNSGTNVWDQLGSDLDGTIINDNFGSSLSMNGDGSIVAIGNDDGGSASGYTIVYEYNSGSNSWVQLGNTILGENIGDKSGYSTSLSDDGNTIVIGAIGNDGANGSDSGHVRVFKYNSGSGLWEKEGSNIDGENAGDGLGRSVSISADGSIIAAGSSLNGANGMYSGHTRIYEFVVMTLGTNNTSFEHHLKAFPNPSHGITDIVFNDIQKEIELNIFNVLGKRLIKRTYQNTDKITLDMNSYSIGTYVAQVKSKDKIATLKLIIK